MELIQVASAKLDANRAYSKAISKEMAAVEPLGDSEFLAALDKLIVTVNRDRRRGIEPTMHNLMCCWVYGSGFGDVPDGWPSTPDRSVMRNLDDDDQGATMHKCWKASVAFLNGYEKLKSSLSKLLWELPGLDRGEDGFGDLIDSLPLAGRAVLDGLFQEDIANFKQLEKALADNPLKEFIINGENYITMRLTEALEKAFLSVARDLTRNYE
jgi:hypothetical protein